MDRRLLLGSLLACSCIACSPRIPPEALALTPQSLARRQMQTRVFATDNEAQVLSASLALLQDLGFTIVETSGPLGVVVGSKERTAVEAGQVAASIAFAILFGVPLPIDKDQTIRCSVVTQKLTGDRSGTAVRVTFQRVVRNTQGQISKIEGLYDPMLYQEFFDRLGKALFLEAEAI
ncbi:MAG: hypothetical protein RMJ04_13380 [Geminicoccaceae bacterium]|nr:hypothetical protein [Geminicoccaceae bacterium]MDW8125756.1 hypothetical protein [Geminicoccaceae bacterium]